MDTLTVLKEIKSKLVLDIDSATQYATVYYDGRPVATVQRKRIYASGKTWSVYNTDGKLIRETNYSTFILQAVAAYLVTPLHNASFHQLRASMYAILARIAADTYINDKRNDFTFGLDDVMRDYQEFSAHAAFHASQARLYMGI